MKSVLDDIITTLRNAAYSVNIPDENILDAYTPEVPDFTEPYIFVDEVTNSVELSTFTHQEEFSILVYDIEIYCRQMSVNGTVLPAKKVSKIIGAEVDSAISSSLGLVRTVTSFAPYDDPSVSRYVLTYEGVLDLTSDYLYRR